MNKEVGVSTEQLSQSETNLEYIDQELSTSNSQVLTPDEIDELFDPQLDIIYDCFLTECSKGKQYSKNR